MARLFRPAAIALRVAHPERRISSMTGCRSFDRWSALEDRIALAFAKSAGQYPRGLETLRVNAGLNLTHFAAGSPE
jgi:hypothetical protein